MIKITGQLTKGCIYKYQFSLVGETVIDTENYRGYTVTIAMFSLPRRRKESRMN